MKREMMKVSAWVEGDVETKWKRILERIEKFQLYADNLEVPYELEILPDCILLVENGSYMEEVWMFRKTKKRIYFEFRGDVGAFFFNHEFFDALE